MKSIRQYINEETVREAVSYHVEHNIPLAECVFRPYSIGFFEFFAEARKQYQAGLLEVHDPFDRELLETNLGEFAVYEEELVPLDFPLTEEDDKKVELGKPKRGGSKKFYVYVKNEKGNVVKVEFGDTSGLDVNFDDLEARKSFAARHQCHMKKDRTKPGYWSCNLPRYASQLGLKNGGNFFW